MADRPVAAEGEPGYFVQGGHEKPSARGKEFIVGAEEYCPSLTATQTAYKAKWMALPVAK